MKKYLQEYIKEIDLLIKDKKINDNIINNHLIKINFFQHERLIHLLVTLSYALFFLIMIVLTIYIPYFLPIMVIMTVILFLYVKHYFFLENGVQYLYKQYDILLNLKDKKYD